MFWTSESFRLLPLCREKTFRALLVGNGRRTPYRTFCTCAAFHTQPDWHRGSLALKEGKTCPCKLCLYATACLWEPTSCRARISCGVPSDRQGEISDYIFCMSGACSSHPDWHAPVFRASEGMKGAKTFDHIFCMSETCFWYAHSDSDACISGELPSNKHGKTSCDICHTS